MQLIAITEEHSMWSLFTVHMGYLGDKTKIPQIKQETNDVSQKRSQRSAAKFWEGTAHFHLKEGGLHFKKNNNNCYIQISTFWEKFSYGISFLDLEILRAFDQEGGNILSIFWKALLQKISNKQERNYTMNPRLLIFYQFFSNYFPTTFLEYFKANLTFHTKIF